MTEVRLPWQLDMIKQAARIHFGTIFGSSIRELSSSTATSSPPTPGSSRPRRPAIAKDEFLTGLELESRIYAPLGALLEEFDALICPTFAIPALSAEYDVGDEIAVNGQPCANWMDVMMTLPFNIASRCPVLSVPSGLSRDGVPTGLSVVGKTYDDIAAFRVAAAHEERFPWLDKPSRRPDL